MVWCPNDTAQCSGMLPWLSLQSRRPRPSTAARVAKSFLDSAASDSASLRRSEEAKMSLLWPSRYSTTSSRLSRIVRECLRSNHGGIP